MYSTDHNINNPLSIDGINLSRVVDSWKSPSIEMLTQEMYDLLQVKDPLRIYVITGSDEGRIYLGDHLIPKERVSSKYFIGINKDTMEYILYMNIYEKGYDRLVPICGYDDPMTAFDALSLCSNVGSHQNVNLALFSAMAAFIDGLSNINDLVIGAMCLFGYKNDPRLQHLIEVIISFGGVQSRIELPAALLEYLENDSGDNPLFKIYLDTYKVIERYNFFKEGKYHLGVDKLDLDKPISEIISAIGVYTKPFGEYDYNWGKSYNP